MLLAGLLTLAAAQYAWSLATHQPFVGYDVASHLWYAATIVDEARLPHPLEGWSTFHPPLYYLLLASVSWPTAPVWPGLLLESLSALSILVTGTLCFLAVRALRHAPVVAAAAAALLFFIPFVQLSGTMIGNEALGACFCALAAVAGLRLHVDPRRAGCAAATGLVLGLALATKFTGIFAAPALIVPYLRRDFDRHCLRAASLGVLVAIGVAGAPYIRNLALTGSPIPMTLDHEPVARFERMLTIRERRLSDYLWLDPSVFLVPVVYLQKPPKGLALNPVMTNVWSLAYASAWHDAREVRVADAERAAGARAGTALLLLGILPTALTLLGGALSLRDLTTRGLTAASAPLSGIALLGGVAFIAYTVREPSVAAVKASYLLPLAVPAAVFFARGVDSLGGLARTVSLTGSMAAALGALVLFTKGVIFSVYVDRSPGAEAWMTPGVAEAAADLEGASAGRWLKVEAAQAAGGETLWRLKAHDYPKLRDAKVAIWCGYVESAMASRAPGQPWRAAIMQGADLRLCAPPSSIP